MSLCFPIQLRPQLDNWNHESVSTPNQPQIPTPWYYLQLLSTL